ncbi:hypothetical protein BJ508DRAFT_360802 [Ascobolus immersus RN42]|uniref:Uncharacterized protein n=1 Tax=Ascobolus immersus RN42 TaxID=1160509 RepID=A0A3N4I9S8_ASCIM|nr:hypothetical protein BJ508DRAFT_360802 [Ascobolus immersus RN42]
MATQQGDDSTIHTFEPLRPKDPRNSPPPKGYDFANCCNFCAYKLFTDAELEHNVVLEADKLPKICSGCNLRVCTRNKSCWSHYGYLTGGLPCRSGSDPEHSHQGNYQVKRVRQQFEATFIRVRHSLDELLSQNFDDVVECDPSLASGQSSDSMFLDALVLQFIQFWGVKRVRNEDVR